jgi:hypothetical protein
MLQSYLFTHGAAGMAEHILLDYTTTDLSTATADAVDAVTYDEAALAAAVGDCLTDLLASVESNVTVERLVYGRDKRFAVAALRRPDAQAQLRTLTHLSLRYSARHAGCPVTVTLADVLACNGAGLPRLQVRWASICLSV